MVTLRTSSCGVYSMPEYARVALFAEDVAHERFLVPLIRRLAREEGRTIRLDDTSARGGRPKLMSEFKAFQKAVLSTDIELPDLIVCATDANCSTLNERRNEILRCTNEPLKEFTVVACPDPHVERWFFADQNAFNTVIGPSPAIPQKKCERDYYKGLLKNAAISAGHVVTLEGLEFADDIVAAMDIYRAGRNETSLGHAVGDIRAGLQRLTGR